MSTRKPLPADKWLASVKPLDRWGIPLRFTGDGPYPYVTNGEIMLSASHPDSPLPANNIEKLVTASRSAAITGKVSGLRAAVRTLKTFAENGVCIAVNGRLDLWAEIPTWDSSASDWAKTYIDGSDYSHSGPDIKVRCSYRYLMQALDGLPETVTYRIDESHNVAFTGMVDGIQREAIIACLDKSKPK